MKQTFIALLSLLLLLTGCSTGTATERTTLENATENLTAEYISENTTENTSITENTAEAVSGYRQISQEKAKEMMENPDVLILDVREQEEYDSGHIPGAILLPVGAITGDSAAEVIPAKDTTVLVYCRSGNRSKTASAALAELGYGNIYEFGGINTWEYGTER